MNRFLTSLFLTLFSIFIHSCNESDDQEQMEPDQQNLSCLPTNLQDGVVAFYPFNNGSIDDFSGGNLNLTNNTAITITEDRQGNSDCAIDFVNDNTSSLTYENPSFLNDIQFNGFSVSFWYFPENTGGALFSRGTNAALCNSGFGEWSYTLGDTANNGLTISQSFRMNGQRRQALSTNDNPSWIHIVATCNDLDLNIYVDGELGNTSGFEFCPEYSENIGNLFIGYAFDGKIDDMIFYDRVLTADEALQLSNLDPCCN